MVKPKAPKFESVSDLIYSVIYTIIERKISMKSLLPILVLNLFLAAFMSARCPADELNGGPLVIKEFMASNSSFIRDPQGQYDD